LNEIQTGEVPPNYKSMLLQTVSMFFWHNPMLTF